MRSGRCHRLAVVAGGIPVSSPEKVELSAEPALGDNHRIKITHRAAVAGFARGIGPHVDAPRTRIAQQDRFDPLAFPTLVTQRTTCVPLTPLKRRGRAVEAARDGLVSEKQPSLTTRGGQTSAETSVGSVHVGSPFCPTIWMVRIRSSRVLPGFG